MHRKPVLLMATFPSDGPGPEELVTRVARRYPEIKAVIYDGNLPDQPLLVREYRRLLLPSADYLPKELSSPKTGKKAAVVVPAKS